MLNDRDQHQVLKKCLPHLFVIFDKDFFQNVFDVCTWIQCSLNLNKKLFPSTNNGTIHNNRIHNLSFVVQKDISFNAFVSCERFLLRNARDSLCINSLYFDLSNWALCLSLLLNIWCFSSVKLFIMYFMVIVFFVLKFDVFRMEIHLPLLFLKGINISFIFVMLLSPELIKFLYKVSYHQ